jgi:tetratricopeptide (TPR) repeat protein
MNRENILFAVVGLLLGYVIAFHLVVYVNQNQPVPRAASTDADSASGLPADHPPLSASEEKDRQRLQAAAEAAGKAARDDANNFDAQTKAANAYFEAGDFEDTIDFLTRANKLRPDDYDTLVRLGNAYSSAERFDDAERWYTAALSKRPDDCDTRSELALAYYLREPKQTDKAVAELRRCLAVKPDHVPSLHNLSLMMIEQKQFAEAESLLARLEKADPTYEQLPTLRAELEKARRGDASAPADAGGKSQKKTPTD